MIYNRMRLPPMVGLVHGSRHASRAGVIFSFSEDLIRASHVILKFIDAHWLRPRDP